jgi:hypothetical protein
MRTVSIFAYVSNELVFFFVLLSFFVLFHKYHKYIRYFIK